MRESFVSKVFIGYTLSLARGNVLPMPVSLALKAVSIIYQPITSFEVKKIGEGSLTKLY